MKAAGLAWIGLACVLVVQVSVLLRTEPDVPLPRASQAAALDGPRAAALARRVDALESGLSAGLAELEGRLAGAAPEPRAALEARADESELIQRLERIEQRLDALEGRGREAEEQALRRRRNASALNTAIARGDLLEVQRLLDAGLDVDARDEDRNTPLAAAAAAGELEAIDLLIARGAQLERTSGRRGMTPLLAALDADQGEAALALLSRGSSIEAVDKNGEGALIWASFNGAERVVHELVARDAKLDFQAHDGNTALMDAARRGHLGIVRLLLEGGAHPNVENREGETALSLALAEQQVEIAALLREYGAH